MLTTVILDAGVLGMVTNPKRTPDNEACRQWVNALLMRDIRVVVPEIADYEVRRELLRANKTNGLRRLNKIIEDFPDDYLPITTDVMRSAATLWAQARQQGKQTAPDSALDGDMILVAQALALALPSDEIVIATHNVSDIARFFPADNWQNITV